MDYGEWLASPIIVQKAKMMKPTLRKEGLLRAEKKRQAKLKEVASWSD